MNDLGQKLRKMLDARRGLVPRLRKMKPVYVNDVTSGAFLEPPILIVRHTYRPRPPLVSQRETLEIEQPFQVPALETAPARNPRDTNLKALARLLDGDEVSWGP